MSKLQYFMKYWANSICSSPVLYLHQLSQPYRLPRLYPGGGKIQSPLNPLPRREV